jgi:crotonobetainyl-CoA:carnitine CoA-transferase CaiB-like acyl-CoA transferase
MTTAHITTAWGKPNDWGALSGLKVLDLSIMLAGPFCSMMLADHGASVIKIESLEGDTTRDVGPFMPDDTTRAYTGYFQSVNRNKRSLALDLKSPAGKEIFLKLAADADVVLENFRAGVMERLELNYERLSALNPKLVYGALRGFGDPRTGTSPYVNWPAYDVVAQAMGGVIGITGPGASDGRPAQPMKVGPGVGDLAPAMLLAFGVLAAVRHAQQTGQGQFVDVAMYDGILALCERMVYQYSYQGTVPGPEGNAHPLICPYGLFPAVDGWISIAVATDAFWRELAAIMGRPEWGRDPRFAKNAVRVGNAALVNEMVGAWTAARTKAQLTAALGGSVPYGPVNDVADIFKDPHVAARAMLATVEQPGSKRPATIANTPIHMTATPGGVHRRSPLLGEDAEPILTALGYDADAIADLKARRVIL